MPRRQRGLAGTLAALALTVITALTACDGPTESAAESAAAPAPSDAAGTSGAATSLADATTTTATINTPSRDVTVELGVGIGDPTFPTLGNLGYDVQRYVLSLRYDPDTKVLRASTTIELRTTRPLDVVTFDYSGPPVSEATVGGERVERAADQGKLTLALPQSVSTDTGLQVAITAEGVPSTQPLPGVGFPIGWIATDDGAFTLNEPDAAHTWFPSNDHPRDKAAFRFEVTVPEGLDVATNGWPAPPASNGDGTATWVSETDPGELMATYLVQVAIGRFDITTADGPHGLRLRSVTPEGTAPVDLARVGTAIEQLESYFGPYPFDSAGVLVVSAPIGGALETQELPIFDSPPDDAILVHELAHQWFGNDVSPAVWNDIWLNEGPATMAESLVAGAPPPEGDEWEGQDIDDAPAEQLFRSASYHGGAAVLARLRLTVGDKTFFSILREWLERYHGSAATTEQFEDIANTMSGRSLDFVFDPFFEP